MTYASLRECCNDLEQKGELLCIKEQIPPDLIIPEIHRRVFEAGGPALLFENVHGSPFPALSNLFGTKKRALYLFEDCIQKMEWLIKAKIDPVNLLKTPLQTIKNFPFLINALPRKTRRNNLNLLCKISDLPKLRAWPMDGGPFITLPQVISFPPHSRDPKKANVGMYRIQLSGNDYINDHEIGLHYQLHRGIGIHHLEHKLEKQPFKISIAVGGPPSMTLSSIFPLPEGLSEILFSGLLNQKRYRYSIIDDYFIPADADFCICGEVDPDKLLDEGPFGDHLGYYSLKHPFPVLHKIKVYHRPNPIWQFTVVGRPPQEDSYFGFLIHEMVKSLAPNEFPGIKSIHAVDVSGVHPLLLALGSERYMPFRDRKPEEILTQALHLLGQGQTSLAKYLWIASDHPEHPPDVTQVPQFLQYILERLDFQKDLHFITQTTMDTLDYSGGNWNEGSKLVICCNRDKRRQLSNEIKDLPVPPQPFGNMRFIASGILAIGVRPFYDYAQAQDEVKILCEHFSTNDFSGFPLVVLVDDPEFTSATYNNFLWVTFTRSNPSHDIYGFHEIVKFKHWGCEPPMIIDARIKPHHAPVLECDPATQNKAEMFIQKNSSLRALLT